MIWVYGYVTQTNLTLSGFTSKLYANTGTFHYCLLIGESYINVCNLKVGLS